MAIVVTTDSLWWIYLGALALTLIITLICCVASKKHCFFGAAFLLAAIIAAVITYLVKWFYLPTPLELPCEHNSYNMLQWVMWIVIAIGVIAVLANWMYEKHHKKKMMKEVIVEEEEEDIVLDIPLKTPAQNKRSVSPRMMSRKITTYEMDD